MFYGKQIETNFLIEPKDTNHYGNIHGGVIMHHVDSLAFICATRYCRKTVVTAKVHEMDFIKPIQVGNLVNMKARVIRVGRSSLDVEINIYGEDLLTGKRFEVATADFTLVAVDENGRPSPFDCPKDKE